VSILAAPYAQGADPTPIRIGWQPTTTVEAQIAHTLDKTDILEKNGLKGELIMFSYGPAVNEALIAGAIDVGFIGDMPSVLLTGAGAPVTVIARQSVFRGSIVASTKSNIKTIQDLKGKKLYGPFGSSIYLSAINMLKAAGLQPGKDVEIVNMGFADLSDALKAGRIDALFAWDPWVELFDKQNLVRVLKSDTSLTMVVVMRTAFLKAHPEAAENFLKSHIEALLFAARNHALVNQWFREPEAARTLDPSIIEQATAYDPQWKAKSLKDLKLSFSKPDLDRYLGLAKTAYDLKITPKLSPLAERVDWSIADKLDRTDWKFDPASVRVKK
jgi:ABC-type nitrate/sulfonate/bicarbonate transport system substrate-binding protein